MNAEQQRLLIIGDSMSLGITELRGNEVISSIEPTYVNYLREFFKDWQIMVDASIHRRTADVVPVLGELLDRHKPNRVMFVLGGNDADLDWKRFIVSQGRMAHTQVSVEKLRSNLLRLIETTRAHGAEPILSCFVSHDLPVRGQYISKESGMDVAAWIVRGGGDVISERILQEYWHMIETLAAENSLRLVRHGPMLRTFDPVVVLARDGTHPSAAGHRVIARAMIAALSNSEQQAVDPAAPRRGGRAKRLI